jgi:hypothetical protein
MPLRVGSADRCRLPRDADVPGVLLHHAALRALPAVPQYDCLASYTCVVVMSTLTRLRDRLLRPVGQSYMFRHIAAHSCSGLGATYPPRVDSKLDAAATGIVAIMTDLAAAAAPAALGSTISAEVHLSDHFQ